MSRTSLKIRSVLDLYQLLPAEEWLILDVLRQIVIANLPARCKEKISFNVPFFYGNRGICIIWPATIPRGGIKAGVLLGFWYGNKLQDPARYLTHGTNKQVYYRIFSSAHEIDETAISSLLKEAAMIDLQFSKKI